MGTGGGGDSGGGGRRGVGGLTTSGGKSIVPIKSVISVQSKHLADHVNSVYDSQITYTTKIHNQRSRIEDLAFRIARTDKELEDKRRDTGPVTTETAKGGVTVTDIEIHKTENRLQQLLVKVSILDTENGRRKERINCLRREKIAEFKAKKRLEAELERARCICATTAKASQQMVDEKEKTRRELELLKQQVVKDLEAFRGEFHGVSTSLAAAKEATQESNAKLENMARSCPPTSVDEEDTIGSIGQAPGYFGEGKALEDGRVGSARGEQPLSRDKRLGQQSNMAFWMILKKKNDLEDKVARVHELRAILEKISTATSLAKVDDFVPVMLEAEEENYNLFKLINGLNMELEELEVEKGAVNEDVQRLTQAGIKRNQQAVKQSLQRQIDRSRASAETYDQAYSRDVEVIKSIEESLISVFNKVGSNDKAVSKQLAAMGVTDRNILLFLSQIEEQIEYIVQVYNAVTDSTASNNVRRPSTPPVNQATGERVPSVCTPHPPSSEKIDDTLGVTADEDADNAHRPIDTARAAVTMKEQILRMPQGTKGGGVLGKGAVAKAARSTVLKNAQGSEEAAHWRHQDGVGVIDKTRTENR
ncbi:unnamed protein product [Ascophyllum nodosum]